MSRTNALELVHLSVWSIENTVQRAFVSALSQLSGKPSLWFHNTKGQLCLGKAGQAFDQFVVGVPQN